jgi:1-acyl-sn-glycerol-3-phosphate acyltransferase
MLVIYLLRVFVQTVLLFFATLKVTGRSNIPETGPYLLAVNHMSKADPPLIFVTWPAMRWRFFAGEKWERHLVFGPLMRWAGAIYINRGEVDRKALRQALDALNGGSIFGLAPEGTRSRVGALISARDGAAYLATRAGVPVLPVGVVNTDVLGKNMLRLRRTRLELRVGLTFTMPDLGRRARGADLAAYTHLIMVHIAALIPERYWGVYSDSPALFALLEGNDPWPYCLQAEGVTSAEVSHFADEETQEVG